MAASATPEITVIDIPEGSTNAGATQLSQSMEKELERWRKPNDSDDFIIFRAPNRIRESKKHFLEPSVITIGPLNYSDKRFSAMEEIKWQFLNHFLSRSKETDLNVYIKAMKDLEVRTRSCYGKIADEIENTDAFVRMMVLDGCFVLGYLSQELSESKCNHGKRGGNTNQGEHGGNGDQGERGGNADQGERGGNADQGERGGNADMGEHGGNADQGERGGNVDQGQRGDNVDQGDFSFEAGWNSAFIYTDLLLLENQLPYFVIEKLREISEFPDIKFKLVGCLSIFCTHHRLTGKEKLPSKIHHLVHLHYESIVSKVSTNQANSGNSAEPNTVNGDHSHKPANSKFSRVIPCASELREAGVRFRAKSNTHMLDISFNHGVLEIPKLKIGDEFKPLFTNLLAFEQCQPGEVKPHIASLARFLDSLVNTERDLMILQKCEIIENLLSSEEELTSFLNQVSQYVELCEDHYLVDVFNRVNLYCKSSWHRRLAELWRDYFSSPWKTISLIVAVILIVLTFLQSFYAIFAYNHPPPSTKG